MKILLQGMTAITLGDPPVREGVSIAIEDGVITAIEGKARRENGFDKVYAGADRVVMPGLINAHTHLAMVLMRGYADDLPLMRWLEEEIWPLEAQLTEDDVYWGSLLGMAEMIRSGTTCFADMYFHMDQVARAVRESGMRALLAYGMIAPEADDRVERQLEAARSFIEGNHGAASGRIRTAVAPHAPYTCGPALWEGAIELARERDIPIHTHLSETRGEVDRALEQWGQTPIERVAELGALEGPRPVIAAHCVHLRDRDFEILAEHDVQAVHNPTSNLKLGSGFAPVQRLLDRGVNVAIGTDGASSNNDLDLLEEIRLAAFLQKGILGEATALPAPEALKLGTQRGAFALGWERIGTLDVGNRADLVILSTDRPHWTPNYNPISNAVYASQAADVETVIVDGEVIMEGRRITTFDEEEARGHVREYQQRQRR